MDFILWIEWIVISQNIVHLESCSTAKKEEFPLERRNDDIARSLLCHVIPDWNVVYLSNNGEGNL